jgi:hypothetical protein
MDASVGLCARCAHAAMQEGGRSRFWRCLRAEEDARFRRYPPLPVLRCAGYEEGGKLGAESGPPGRARGER